MGPMPYNKDIETRINQFVLGSKDTVQKNMFVGVCYLLKGNIFCGVYKDSLILRLVLAGFMRLDREAS